MILLGIFTLSEAISVSVICLGVGDPDLVLQAFLITSGVVIALTAYAMTAKNDLTIVGGTCILLV
jgi:FtsH-binding integral membrane protein